MIYMVVSGVQLSSTVEYWESTIELYGEYKGEWALQLQCIVGVVVAANATQLQISKYETFMNSTHLLHLPETPEVRVGN